MGDKDAYGKVLRQFYVVCSKIKKRRVWLEKATGKLEKAGIEILWIRYLPKDIIPGFIFEVKTKKTVLELRAYSRSNWRIYSTHNTTYRTTRTIEECIKEIESGKD
jgi:hypothetical protein